MTHHFKHVSWFRRIISPEIFLLLEFISYHYFREADPLPLSGNIYPNCFLNEGLAKFYKVFQAFFFLLDSAQIFLTGQGRAWMAWGLRAMALESGLGSSPDFTY